MTIASEITRINNNIASAYTACNNKGATMPATQNSANLATCIGTITGGGGGGTKYGASVSTFLGDIDTNGVLQIPSEQDNIVFSGVEDVAWYGLYYRCAYSSVKTVSFPDLKYLTGTQSCYGIFYNCQYHHNLQIQNLYELFHFL